MSAPGGILMAKIIMPDDPARDCRSSAEDAEGRRRRDLRGGRAARQHHHGRRPGRADRRQARGRGRRDGARLRRAGRARQRPARRARRPGSAIPTSASSASLGTIFAPVMFLIGVPWNEARRRRRPVRHQDRAQRIRRLHRPRPDGRRRRSAPRSRAIVTFALCGFANFSSIAIQMAVTGGLAPNQRPMIARLGLRGAARRLARQSDERGAGRPDAAVVRHR